MQQQPFRAEVRDPPIYQAALIDQHFSPTSIVTLTDWIVSLKMLTGLRQRLKAWMGTRMLFSNVSWEASLIPPAAQSIATLNSRVLCCTVVGKKVSFKCIPELVIASQNCNEPCQDCLLQLHAMTFEYLLNFWTHFQAAEHSLCRNLGSHCNTMNLRPDTAKPAEPQSNTVLIKWPHPHNVLKASKWEHFFIIHCLILPNLTKKLQRRKLKQSSLDWSFRTDL